jgi:hypothetical protein
MPQDSGGATSAITKRKRGGQPGNISAARHPAKVYWRRRALAAKDAWAERLATAQYDAVTAEFAGTLSATQTLVLSVAHAARVCWLLALTEGPSARADVSRFQQTELRALAEIGVRPPREVKVTLADLMRAPAPDDTIDAETRELPAGE